MLLERSAQNVRVISNATTNSTNAKFVMIYTMPTAPKSHLYLTIKNSLGAARAV